jgi:hypothetical protein
VIRRAASDRAAKRASTLKMFLSITTTHTPATDLGYLLHKNPARTQALDLAFGRVHMFYPEACESRCTFALMAEIDPVALVRGTGGREGGLLEQYVNDRPYAASSFLSVAIVKALRTALVARRCPSWCSAHPTYVCTSVAHGRLITRKIDAVAVDVLAYVPDAVVVVDQLANTDHLAETVAQLVA